MCERHGYWTNGLGILSRICHFSRCSAHFCGQNREESPLSRKFDHLNLRLWDDNPLQKYLLNDRLLLDRWTLRWWPCLHRLHVPSRVHALKVPHRLNDWCQLRRCHRYDLAINLLLFLRLLATPPYLQFGHSDFNNLPCLLHT